MPDLARPLRRRWYWVADHVLSERFLLRDDAVSDRHGGDEVDETRGVAPLVVVPRDELDEGRGEHDASSSVEHGGARLADKVRRDDLVLSVANNALGVRLRCELDLRLDLVVGGGGFKLTREVDD